MAENLQKSLTGAKVKFLLGLAVIISLVYFSMLKKHQVSNYEYALLIAITTTSLLFDYFLLNKLFSLFKQAKLKCNRVDNSIRFALRKILKWPLLFEALKVELLTLYYAFFAKYEGQETTDEISSFSYHKSSNAKDMFLIVAISQLPYLPFIHVLIEIRKGPALAWGITILTLWSVIWFLAQVQAIRFRPIELDNVLLKYRFGLFWKADIPLKQIIKARKRNYRDEVDAFGYFLSPLGSEKNIIIEFETPIQFIGPYFLRKRKGKALISLDRPDQFLTQLSLRGVEIA